MKKIFNKRILMFFALIFMLFSFTDVFAASPSKTTRESIGFVADSKLDKDDIDPGLPSVSSDQIAAYGERKGGELIEILQVWFQPFLVILFIVGAVMVVLGLIFRGPLTKSGFAVLLFSSISYAVIMFAPEIMDAFLSWTRH